MKCDCGGKVVISSIELNIVFPVGCVMLCIKCGRYMPMKIERGESGWSMIDTISSQEPEEEKENGQ